MINSTDYSYPSIDYTLPHFRKYLGQFYTDSLLHDENALKYLVSAVGEKKVVLGSDYPFPLGEHHPGKLIESISDWEDEKKVVDVFIVVSNV